MTPDVIRELTNRFCQAFKKSGGKPSDLKEVSVVLTRRDGYWDLVAKRRKTFNRRDYVTVIDLPDDLSEKPLSEALIDMAGIISAKLSASARTINSNAKRSRELKAKIAHRAVENRWKNHKKD